MPRRKRSSGPSERRRKVRRRGEDDDEEEEDTALIISDSEHDEEEEDCPLKVTSRAARRQDREKTHMQDMTEDEMLDLALRLSEQEANSASRREQVEDADMRKAIAESLQVSSISETCSKRTRSAAKPHQDRDTVTAHVRCKLSFSNKLEKDGGSDEDVSEAQTSLPPMPDLSQKTSSQPSPPSPTISSVPSQESHSSLLVKQEVTAHTPDSSQSDSALKMSPVFLRDCSVRLNPNLLSTSSSSKNLPHTNDSSLGLTSPERSESSPPAPKSPVFLKTDSKRCTKLSRGTLTDCTSHSSFKDNVHKSEDLLGGSSSHKKGDSPKSSSHGRKAPGTSHVPAPEDFVKLRQVKDEGEGSLSTLPDRAPDLKVSSCTDSKSLDEFTSHMVLHLSDDDDEDDEENDKIIPPSPVFPQDRSSHAGQTKLLPTQPCTSSSPPKNSTFQNKSNSQASEQTKALRKSADFKLTPTGKDEGLVSYYWGVPFCPKGQSPDDYTRVILTQLEVYEKSLKEAQRQLLHKVDWGLPVFPCPIERAHSRRLKRHRAPQLLEEEEEDERDEEEREKQKEIDESQPRSEEEAEDGQRETYVVVSSPETELEQKSPSAFGQAEPSNSAKPSSSCRRPVSQEHFKDTEIQPEADENGEEVQNEGFDAESAVCPETQMSEDNTPELMVTSPTQPQMQAETDIMEVDELTEPPAEPEERMEQERSGEEQSWRESVPSQVECPMCSRLFPLCEIEMHAAYCNGSVEEQDHDHTQDQLENLSQGIARRKSIRRTAMEDDVRFEKSEQREKCFICEKFFVTKEYEQHVNQCIRQKSLGHKQGNGLLSALNRTETVHLDDSGAGPSNTAVKNNRSHSDTSAKPADSQAPAYSVSTSPFKSFTPISEIKDCLIDFRQQHTDRTSQRLGRKRKFKR